MKWFIVLGITVCLLFVGLAWAEEENGLTSEEEAELTRILGMGPNDSTNTVSVNIPGAQCIYPKGAWAVISKPNFFSCNLDPCFNLKVEASVAQWVTLFLSATEIKWYILKPDSYDTKWFFGCLASNGDVELVFSGFEDLKSTTDPSKVIPTYYKYWRLWGDSDLSWVRASDFNGVRQIPEPILGTVFRIYNKVDVSHLTPACEYEDPNGATLCVTLKEQKPWVQRPS